MDMPSPVTLNSAEGYSHSSHERSNDIPSSGVAPTASSSTSVKRPRGQNKNSKVNDMIHKDGPLNLEFKDEYVVPVGDNFGAWSRIISKIVLDHCDLHYQSWTMVPDEMVKRLEEQVKDKFVLDTELQKHKDALKHQLGKAYNRKRSALHLKNYQIYFKNVDSDDLVAVANAQAEARANVPTGISLEQWPAICDSFEVDIWKKKSERNKKNRAKMETNHTAGSTTFINIIHKKAKKTNAAPNPIEIYKDTHTNKDGIFVSEYAESKYNEMESIAANSDNTNASQEDIVLKVLGGHRSGHVKGKGCGAKPTKSNSSCNQQNHDECLAKQLETEEKLAAMEASFQAEIRESKASQIAMEATFQAEIKESKASQAAMEAAFQAQIKESKASQAAMQAQMEMLLKHIGGIGGSSYGSQASGSNI
ncbi:uncharacterized protein LOC132174086 [Corylus avellana]|uniref:uncharacterized protein LOC132174086 n=1 Tax=Corylus avellana TaxID=13451 RepID=UPI00286A5169|nr:uncharacterized protein LOC132174086 [Corylus avellana]